MRYSREECVGILLLQTAVGMAVGEEMQMERERGNPSNAVLSYPILSYPIPYNIIK